jgi:hypothetical protein
MRPVQSSLQDPLLAPRQRISSYAAPSPQDILQHKRLTPKILGPFMPITTSKMLIISKKSQKNKNNNKMLKFQPHKDYDLSSLL